MSIEPARYRGSSYAFKGEGKKELENLDRKSI